MKNAVKTALLLSSSLIGAGFATGREICEFCPPHGIFGVLNAVFSCFLCKIDNYSASMTALQAESTLLITGTQVWLP